VADTELSISWTVSTMGFFVFVGRNPHLITRRMLAQARVYAQGFMVAVLNAPALFSQTEKPLDPGDSSYHHITEKRVRHGRDAASEDQWRG
jgi:hypothetical protein